MEIQEIAFVDPELAVATTLFKGNITSRYFLRLVSIKLQLWQFLIIIVF